MGIVVGCDISSQWIDAHCVGLPKEQVRFDNSRQAIDRFARSLPAGSQVGMEATAQLHELLAQRLLKHGHTVFVINPRWIHMYGKSIGVRGKTDRTDAALIARFLAGEAQNLHAYKAPSREHQQLRALLLRRRTVVKLKTATRQSLKEEAQGIVNQFDQLLKMIEKRIAELVRDKSEWQRLDRCLRSQPGVGRIVSASLTEVLTRVPFENADAFVAHTGLDPRPNDSGFKRGRRSLSHHGDASIRTALYLAAMAACKRPEWQALYQAHRGKGLCATAAYVVVARKIARVAFSLFKSGEMYDPSRAQACQTT